jgi:hypothetical protein
VGRAVDDDLDEALARLGAFGPEFGGGLSNHGPMVVEALVRLDRGDAVGAWVDDYVGRLESPIAPSGRRPALGEMATVGDWERSFTVELQEAPWGDVVRRWVPRLAPGLMAAATHGWLRTAHAVRSLRARESPERIGELARGLAYWAARYQEVPGPATPRGRLRPTDGLAALPARHLATDGLIFEVVRGLDGDDEFAAAVSAVDGAALDVDVLLGAAAGEVLGGGAAAAPIVYVHTLTPTAAIRGIEALVDRSVADLVLGCVWRAMAALVTAYPPRATAGSSVPGDVDADAVIERAVDRGDEHAIKVAEAAFGPDAGAAPTVRAAAAALVARLSG